MQRRAGVEAEAGRLENMLDSSELSQGAARFLASQRFAALTGRDHNGVLWVSPLAAPPGFLHGQDGVLHVSASPRDGDPLHEIPVGQQVGLIAIDFATRRRLRINGELVGADHQGMTVRIDQSYGNCPKYIHRRAIDVANLAAPASKLPGRAALLDPSDRAMIATSDTFFLGTSHPTRGSDASHRGGPPGFVRVDSPDRLWWPDFPGTTCSTAMATWRSITKPPCCSSISIPAPLCRSVGPHTCGGPLLARPAMMALLEGMSRSRSTPSQRWPAWPCIGSDAHRHALSHNLFGRRVTTGCCASRGDGFMRRAAGRR